MTEAESNLARARDQLERGRHLVKTRVVTEEDLIEREKAFLAAEAQLARASAQDRLLKAGAWQYDKLVAQAAVDEALAQVEQVKADIDRLTVRALVDGEVLQVNVRPGEFVGAPAGQALIVLGDIDELHAARRHRRARHPAFRPRRPGYGRLAGNAGQGARTRTSCGSSRTWFPRNRSPATIRNGSIRECCR